MATLKAAVRYRGTHFAGWQVQPGQRTIQGAIEGVLSTIAQVPIRIVGAGRTDAGVHALGQVFSFEWPVSPDCEKLHRSLLKMLAPDIRIESIGIAPDGFHAIECAKGKTYAYALYDNAHVDPFTADCAWAIAYSIDRERLLALAKRLEGEHDFQGYCGAGSTVKTTVRTIHQIELHDGPVIGPPGDPLYWHLTFAGNGFLYKMIRNIVGTLVDVARGHLGENVLAERLHAPMPYKGFTAPGHGLFLSHVHYDP